MFSGAPKCLTKPYFKISIFLFWGAFKPLPLFLFLNITLSPLLFLFISPPESLLSFLPVPTPLPRPVYYQLQPIIHAINITCSPVKSARLLVNPVPGAASGPQYSVQARDFPPRITCWPQAGSVFFLNIHRSVTLNVPPSQM